MLFAIGMLVVIAGVFGSFAAIGGDVSKLWQPGEIGIIAGAAIGSWIIANSGHVLRRTMSGMGDMLRGPRHGHADYLELIGTLYQIFRLGRSKGTLGLEPHVENPRDSQLFGNLLSRNPKAVTFLCDYLRLLTSGAENVHTVEALMDEDLDAMREEGNEVPHALAVVADACPALGIVAAVLGVIKTMSSIGEPPEVLGGLIAGALVGTFVGVFLGYAVLGPMAASLKTVYDRELIYLQCIKAGVLAYMQQYPPAICIEFSRKTLHPQDRPSFQELEDHTQSLPPV